MMGKYSKKLASFDAFPKVEEGYTRGTESGGIVTTIVACIVTFLLFSELSQYMKITEEYEFLVDPSIQRNMLLNFDLTVNMPCNFLNFDIHDASHSSLHLTDKIKKASVNFETKKAKSLEDNMDKAYQQAVGRVVGLAGNRHGIDFNNINQKSTTGGEACRIFGTFEVKKLQGNFHITPLGHGHGGQHMDHQMINFTHRIDTFSFGNHFPKLINPLDNSLATVTDHMAQYQYFISVVPTSYVNRYGRSVDSNQYSVTDFISEADPMDGKFPGLFFKYDIEPLMVKITEKKQSIITFLVRLCGIIGGVYVSSGILHRILMNLVSFKQQQNKSVNKSFSGFYNSEKRI